MPEPLSRYFRVEPDAYEALTQYVDTSRGFPNETTQRGLQLFEWLPHEEDGWGIIAIDGWRFTENDEAVITAAIEAGTVEELDRETYWAKRNALRNPPEPEPEEPEEPDPRNPPERYLKFRAKSSAEKRSKELWAQKLGRPVEPGEDTTHLYRWTRSHKRYGGSMLIVNDDGDLLTADEKEDLGEVGDEEWVEWTEKYQPEPD